MLPDITRLYIYVYISDELTKHAEIVKVTTVQAGQIPRNGLTLGSCLQQWGSHYYMILTIFLIRELYW